MTLRRDFLAFSAGAVAAGTVLPLAARADGLHPDAKLLGLGRLMEKARAEEQVAWAAAAGEDDDDGPLTMQANALFEAVGDVVAEIEDAPATTIDGLLVKARAIDWCRSGKPVTAYDLDRSGRPPTDMRIIAGLIQDLIRIGRVEA